MQLVVLSLKPHLCVTSLEVVEEDLKVDSKALEWVLSFAFRILRLDFSQCICHWLGLELQS